MNILFNPKKHTYEKNTKTFSVSEADVQFATEYRIINPKTQGEMEFTFSHSTGPEFDPNTKYVYKSGEYTLEVCNDKQITEHRAKLYLQAKTRN